MNLIPIAALNQYAYCPHRCWRMFCAGEFIDNQYTLEGTGLHDRVHTLGSGLRDDIWQVRAIWLKSEKYGLVGKADLIEEQDGQLFPVEYKRGHKGNFDNDALQVCAQALCLEDMTGKPVTQGYVYYAQTHQRQPVAIDDELRQAEIARAAIRHTPILILDEPTTGLDNASEQAVTQALQRLSRHALPS